MHNTTSSTRPALATWLGCLLAVASAANLPARLEAQIRLADQAVVYSGSPITSTAPATLDFRRVRNATPEWREIQSQGIRRGSARYRLLSQQMHRRICKIADRIAAARGFDLVVRKRDVEDSFGRDPINVTAAVIAGLGRHGAAS